MSSPDKPEAAAEVDAGAARRYRIRHITDYRYQSPVVLAQHLLHLKPRAVAEQKDVTHHLAIEPQPRVVAEHRDCFDNPAIYIAIQEPHQGLTLTSELTIERRAAAAPIDLAATPPWDALRDRLAVAAEPEAREAAAFAYPSPRIPYTSGLLAYAQESFAPGMPIGVAARHLTARIHADFAFDSTATTVATPLDQVFAARRGVCQDFAHLEIACLRALGLSARYISGYLRTRPPEGAPRLRGADASHAWLSVWCNGENWLDLDPTNDQIVGGDHITLAWGRDYDDVSPVRGVLFGGGANRLAVSVDVEMLAADEPCGPAANGAASA